MLNSITPFSKTASFDGQSYRRVSRFRVVYVGSISPRPRMNIHTQAKTELERPAVVYYCPNNHEIRRRDDSAFVRH